MVNLNSFSDSKFSADAQKSGNKNQASNIKLVQVEYPSGGTLQWWVAAGSERTQRPETTDWLSLSELNYRSEKATQRNS